MPTLQELRIQIAELEKQAADLHQRESQAAVATVVDLIKRYGLTASQVGLAPSPAGKVTRKMAVKVPSSSRTGAGVPKFADPVTGKTWTGFGKAPAWIAGVPDRNAFRIDGQEATVPRKSAAKKAGAGRKLKPAKSQ